MAGTVITKKGLQLIAKLVASGTALTFTRVSVGTGSVPAGYDPGSMTDLNNYKMDGSISSCSFLGDEASIIMQISSLGVENGFTITETGLFATDPDEGEILYSYLDLSKDPQYVYEENSAISKFVEMTLVVKVGTVERVTAQLNPRSLLTRDGDISDTSIKELEPIDTKYPVPVAGESTKVFMGKVKKYIEDTKPLDADMFVYVATTGSDTTGDGTSSKPYKTITYALSKIPKMLNGFTAAITVSGGVYNETVQIEGFTGKFEILLAGNVAVKGFNVIRSTVTCRSSDTTARLLSVIYINVDSGRLDSFSNISINTTGFLADAPYASRNSSIFVSRGELYLSGVVNLLGNTDIGVAVATVSNAFIGTLIGTGLTMGKYITTGSQLLCAKTNISASQADWVYTGVRVGSYGAMIGTLPDHTTLYVATTGSDTTGDGTSAKPYKTIQYALNTLPRDLGGRQATIIINPGVYAEAVNISNFYNGQLYVRSTMIGVVSDAVTINYLSIVYCTANIVIDGIKINNSAAESSVWVFSSMNVLLNSLKLVTSAPSKRGIYCAQGNIVSVSNCDITGKWIAISHINTSGYIRDCTGSGNSYAIESSGCGSVHLVGTYPGSMYGLLNTTGGTFLNENGTQISGIISSGLSCTWGTIQGGYVRHGNMNGTAMVTVQLRITITTPLSGGTEYTITGFPQPVITPAVTVHDNNVQYAQINNPSGTLWYRPINAIGTGYNIMMSCTYLTNS